MRGCDDASMRFRRFRLLTAAPTKGVALGWVCVALVAIIGLVGMAFDVGTLEVAAQRCQEVADSAALGAAAELPSGAVTTTAVGIADANNTDGHGWPVSLASDDVNVYGPGTTVGGTTLAAHASAVEVTVRGPVEFRFIRMMGLEMATARRTAIAMRSVAGSGYPFVPIWIDYATAEEAKLTPEPDDPHYAPGSTDVLMAQGPSYEGIPGAFGFLDADGTNDPQLLSRLLAGTDLTEEEANSFVFDTTDTITSMPGLSPGLWEAPLNDRIEAGSTGIYSGDTAASFHPGNPRVIITALVTYVGASGTNAAFRIDGYVAFFLESAGHQGNDKYINATFLDYYVPGDETWGTPWFDGFYSVKLIM